MGVSLLPKNPSFCFPLKKKKWDLPRGGESLAAGWIIGTGPADDIAFPQTPQSALSCLFPFLVGQSPRRGRKSGKGPGQHAQKGHGPGRILAPILSSGMASLFSGLPHELPSAPRGCFPELRQLRELPRERQWATAKNSLPLPLSWSLGPTLLHCWWALRDPGAGRGRDLGKASFQAQSGRDVQTQRVAQRELGLEAQGENRTGLQGCKNALSVPYRTGIRLLEVLHLYAARRSQGPGLRRGRKDGREKGLTPRKVGCEASLRSLPGSVILQLLEAWQTSGSPTGGLPASWPRWLLHTQQPTPVLVALASSSFFIWVWRELSGPPSPAWAPSSLTHSGRLETSWLSPLRVSWQSLGLPREGRAQKPPSGAGLGQGAAPAGRRRPRAAR
ncbi:uncharacterized protein LOC131495573 [Neofelis nebulosa]|uniref:uncharacterized protein LOC131495573 n=1 Tax=Neofelis nebulosa TaxID=61452 RepID=UPI00272A27F9|nr:uncharacterized protein LOC131495573 [Neofelis nebulosa]